MVPPHHVEPADVEVVVRVQVADQHGVEPRRVDVALQRAERAAAEVEQHPPGAALVDALEQVAARRRLGAGERPRAADHGDVHALRPGGGPGELVDELQLGAEEAPADGRELLRLPRGEEPVRRRGQRGVPLEPVLDEQPVDVLGGLLGRRHQRHLVPHHVGDRPGEQRVVGAAEDQRVDALGDQRVEVAVRDLEQLRAAGHAGLHELDEPGQARVWSDDVRGGGERVVVGHRLGGRRGADHADPAGREAATARRVAGWITSTTGTGSAPGRRAAPPRSRSCRR